ncbi:MAG: hypothetical protein ACLQUY_09575 [Ktedonobacterales bacterium]
MDDVRFDRQFRTSTSEGYYMVLNTTRIGSLDLHFTSTTVHCTLVLEREFSKADLAKLIEQIDEDLVLSADTPRDDFLVSVYLGKEVGFFNDDFRADQEELGPGGQDEEEEDDDFGEENEEDFGEENLEDGEEDRHSR